MGDKVCLKGNVDTVLLEEGPPLKIENIVKECIDVAAPGGGYILSAVDQPTPRTPHENMAAFVRAGKKYGRY
ncbi:hypothetical protein DRO64_03545 [Candidatus Bathyarchaeota archaeon]|nr:MAG: hypothetical protein DRO64_03545 [Candidatus Bathyarchaeota archaeon]